LAKQLKLMADYECWPLWLADPDGGYNIDPADLPINADLVQRLNNWASAFDSTLDLDAPASAGFANQEALDAFMDEGERLWVLLRNQLHPDYEVRYQKAYSAEALADPESEGF
jgi:hypothetical protein